MDLSIISSLGEEALAPLHKAIADELPEKRGTALLKAQQAVRGFVAAMERGEEPVEPQEPIARLVHDILAKAAPSRSPRVAKEDAALAKSVDAELRDLVQNQTDLAFERLEKGYLSALRAMNPIRRAGMRGMLQAARGARDSSMAATRAGVKAARERGIDSVSTFQTAKTGRTRGPAMGGPRWLDEPSVGPARGGPAMGGPRWLDEPSLGPAMPKQRIGNIYRQKAAGEAAVDAHLASGKRYARTAGVSAANQYRRQFGAKVRAGRREAGAAALSIGAGLGAASAYNSRRRSEED